MAAAVSWVSWCLLLLVHRAAGSLHVDVMPSDILQGLTSSMTLNCTFSYEHLSNISSIISLIISKSSSQNNDPQKFVEIASINAFAPQHVNEFLQVNATATGQMGGGSVSWLSMHWTDPTEGQAGSYRCDANVVDQTGHPVDISTIITVTSSQPDLPTLIEIFNKLQATLENQLTHQTDEIRSLENRMQVHEKTKTELQQLAANQTATIATFEAKLVDQKNAQSALASQVAAQSKRIQNIETDIWRASNGLQNGTSCYCAAVQACSDNQARLEDIVFTAMFEKSEEINGRYYLLSKQRNNMVNVSEKYCEYMGGYLAEVDYAVEHNFIRAFLNNYTFDTDYVYIGASADQDHEGKWIYRNSTQPVLYADWAPLEPKSDYVTFDCMLLDRTNNWQMASRNCYSSWYYLCEIPVN